MRFNLTLVKTKLTPRMENGFYGRHWGRRYASALYAIHFSWPGASYRDAFPLPLFHASLTVSEGLVSAKYLTRKSTKVVSLAGKKRRCK